ncbi:MAG: hypothetical protein QOD99_2703 [Chthoniobacter sp.]|jgi:membrane associated rhomboid family serine protease|nr:hypothetical protein [Chthoniobacter sp.]
MPFDNAAKRGLIFGMRSPRLQHFTRRWAAGRQSVVTLLIVANVACFLAQMLTDVLAPGVVQHWFALSGAGIRSGCVWQFATYMFLHGGPMHLLLNMLTLYFAGREVEAIAGPKHLLGVYLGGGLLGGLAHVIFSSAYAPVLGASAGVCAVLIGFTTILPEIEITTLLFFVIPIRLRAKYLAMGIVGFEALCAVTGSLPELGHVAHLGGSVFGWLYMKQLGFGNPLRIQKYVFEKRQRAERQDRMTPSQFINEEIDPILDKISREGIHSLSRSERKILEKGRAKIAQKTAGR